MTVRILNQYILCSISYILVYSLWGRTIWFVIFYVFVRDHICMFTSSASTLKISRKFRHKRQNIPIFTFFAMETGSDTASSTALPVCPLCARNPATVRLLCCGQAFLCLDCQRGLNPPCPNPDCRAQDYDVTTSPGSIQQETPPGSKQPEEEFQDPLVLGLGLFSFYLELFTCL